MSRHGTWMNVTDRPTPASSQHWPPSTAVSTCAVIVSSEQSGHFQSVTGTDKIVLSQPTTSPRIAPIVDARDQGSDQSNKPRVQHPDTY